MLSGEATNTNLTVFGLTWPGLEATIYRTQGEHANHYANDAVVFKKKIYSSGKGIPDDDSWVWWYNDRIFMGGKRTHKFYGSEWSWVCDKMEVIWWGSTVHVFIFWYCFTYRYMLKIEMFVGETGNSIN